MLFLFATALTLTTTALATAKRGDAKRVAKAGGPAVGLFSPASRASSTTTVRHCPLPAQFRPAFERASKATGFSLSLLVAVAQVESNFQPNAASHAGARGLLQVLPSTARELQIDLDDPGSDVLAGARYLKRMRARFGSLELALAAYNAGPTAVERAGSAPSDETRAYVSEVLGRWQQLAGCS